MKTCLKIAKIGTITPEYSKYSKNHCIICNNLFTIKLERWCKSCQLEQLKKIFINQTSGNKKIDNFIKKIQLKIGSNDDIVFEWIPYNQFNNIKEIGKDGDATVYSTIWKDGRLCWNKDNKKYIRKSDMKVSLKCLHDSYNMIDDFLNKI